VADATPPVALDSRTRQAVVIAVAPNGARRTTKDHPRLPVEIAAIAEDALQCERHGASLIHLHVRDPAGAHVLDAGLYREAIQEIRRTTEGRLLVQITTEAVGRYSPDEQMLVARGVEADSLSLALREIAPDAQVGSQQREFFRYLADSAPAPQYILYDAADTTRLLTLIQQGVISPERMSVLFVLGRYVGGQVADPRSLIEFLPYAHHFESWFVCAFGVHEARCVVAAAALGGHARVGFENNLQRPDGAPADSNAENVGRVAQTLKSIGMQPARVDEARRILSGRAHATSVHRRGQQPT
jgi:3-keto-5-aminohexanoate cleavage enzyme